MEAFRDYGICSNRHMKCDQSVSMSSTSRSMKRVSGYHIVRSGQSKEKQTSDR